MNDYRNDSANDDWAANAGLSDADKERIRSDEIRASEERRYREEVRRQIRQGGAARSTWERCVAVLKAEEGVFSEIAADSTATGQALLVFMAATIFGSILAWIFLVFTLPLGLAYVLAVSGLVCLVSGLFSDEAVPYKAWLRAMCYAALPTSFSIVPLIGAFVGGIYCIVLQIIAIREVARITTGRAIAVWLIVAIVPLTLIGILVGFAGLAMLGAMAEEWF